VPGKVGVLSQSSECAKRSAAIQPARQVSAYVAGGLHVSPRLIVLYAKRNTEHLTVRTQRCDVRLNGHHRSRYGLPVARVKQPESTFTPSSERHFRRAHQIPRVTRGKV
jgi:hypothetical protein